MSAETFLNGRVTMHCGDSRDVLKTIPDCSIDSIVTDPPYALVSIVKRFGAGNAAAVKIPEGGSGAYARASAGFMGKAWDTGETAFAVEFWAECMRVLKPGGHVVAFSGTRTYHRMASAIEDAGFEIRDMVQWLYGSGFPKSHDTSKGIDDHLFGVWLDEAPARRADYAKDMRTARESSADDDVRRKTVNAVERMWREIGGFEREVVGDKVVWGSNAEGGRGGQYANGQGPSAAGATREIGITAPAAAEAQQWDGWGTAIKPANEPICMARKPLSEKTVAANVLRWGTGAINIDGCRIESGETVTTHSRGDAEHFAKRPCERTVAESGRAVPQNRPEFVGNPRTGRFPANIIHDGSDEVLAAFPETDPSTIGKPRGAAAGDGWGMTATGAEYDDSGSAARFYYTAKADSDDRLGSKHPTIKPVNLMQWLIRLVTPKGGTALDPFAGTGTTGEAAFREGFNAVLIEREPEYQADIRRRMSLCMAGPQERRRESIKAKLGDVPFKSGSLFAGIDAAE